MGEGCCCGGEVIGGWRDGFCGWHCGLGGGWRDWVRKG